mgnify:CR=1 FL=1
MKRTDLTFILLLFFGISLHAQKKDYTPLEKKQTESPKKMMLIEQDSMIVSEIELDEVIVLQKLEFKNKTDLRRYLILKRKTKKVWPYAVLAAERLEKLTARLATLDSERKKRRYTKRIQKYIEGEFTDKLKKMTRTEGQILVKLMYRQTGTTTFDLVKDLRSGWKAFWYNSTASMFDISLKEKYDPYEVEEDYLIEDILLRAFKNNTLENQKPAIDIDYLDIVEHWQKKEKETKTVKL